MSAQERQMQFFPWQLGPPTPYAKSRRALFIAIGIYQALMGIMALIEFKNYLSGIVMLIGVLIAGMALKEDMNITYICWWGVLSSIGFVVSMVSAFMAFETKLSSILIKFNVPFSCFCGMAMTWWLYSNYEQEHPEATDMFGGWLRSFGLLPKQVPVQGAGYAATLLSKDHLPQFGGAFGADAYKMQAEKARAMGQQYGAAGQQYGQQATAMGTNAMNAASGYGANAQTQAASGFAGIFGTAAAAGGMQAEKAQATGQQYGAVGQQYGQQANAIGANPMDTTFGHGEHAQAQAESGFAGLFGTAAATGGPKNVRADPFLTH